MKIIFMDALKKENGEHTKWEYYKGIYIPSSFMNQRRPEKKRGEIITRLISLIAIALSFGSLYLNYSFNSQNAESSAIKDIYATFFDLDRLALNNWQLSHVFTTPEGYDTIKAKIILSVKSAEPTQLIELGLKERALALQILDYYEQTLYLLEHAKRNNLKERQKFIQAVVDYFSGRILRNPRLLYFWSVLSTDYESSTIEYYNRHVLNDKNYPLLTKADTKGPFSKNH